MDSVILERILKLWLEGMDGYAGHPVPNDLVDKSITTSTQQKNPSPMKRMGLFCKDCELPVLVKRGIGVCYQSTRHESRG